MIICYDLKRIIVGISEVLYRCKWYTILYAEETYVIIQYANRYTKLMSYEIEDTEYNTIVETETDIILPTSKDIEKFKRDGEYVIRTYYDIDSIEACKRDMELIKTNNLKLYFTSGMLTMVEPNSNNLEICSIFKSVVKGLLNIPLGDNRRGINIVMVDNMQTTMFNSFNSLLDKYDITTDNDAIKCLNYKFILELSYMLEGE